MRRTIWTKLLLSCAICSLAACGGGGGGGSGFNSTPTPPPPPTTTAVNIFPSITASTEFASLGAELSGNPGAPITTDGFSIRYDAASNAYIFDLPTHNPSAFHTSVSQTNPAYWVGGLVSASPGVLWPPMSVLKASPTNPQIQLSYTSFASYLQAGPMEDRLHGVVAFGLATPSSAIPTSGSATMAAIVRGLTLDGNGIDGTATLQFDFGAGTLSGHFDPVLFLPDSSSPLGQYAFVNTVFGIGSTTFSGNFAHANPQLTGAFNGLFTGPNAQELMARWTAGYINPSTQQQGEMFGIWVGKKCC